MLPYFTQSPENTPSGKIANSTNVAGQIDYPLQKDEIRLMLFTLYKTQPEVEQQL